MNANLWGLSDVCRVLTAPLRFLTEHTSPFSLSLLTTSLGTLQQPKDGFHQHLPLYLPTRQYLQCVLSLPTRCPGGLTVCLPEPGPTLPPPTVSPPSHANSVLSLF